MFDPKKRFSPESPKARLAAAPLNDTSRPGALRGHGICGCGLRVMGDIRQDARGVEHPFYYFERDGATPEGWYDKCPRCGLDHYAAYCDRVRDLIGGVK